MLGTVRELPKRFRRGRRTLIRTNSGGGTTSSRPGSPDAERWLSYSAGVTPPAPPARASLFTAPRRTDPAGDRPYPLDLFTWMPLLAPTGALLREPRRLRLRVTHHRRPQSIEVRSASEWARTERLPPMRRQE